MSKQSPKSPALPNVAGLHIVSIKTADVRPNPFNPNVQRPEIFTRELRSIERHGFIDPITIRENAQGQLEIVDGEHRWKAATQLGILEIPAVHLGKLSEEDARRLVLLFNDLRGESEPVKLSKLLQELVVFSPAEELSKDLPMATEEINALVNSLSFSWDSLPNTPGLRGDDHDGSKRTGAEQRKFVVGGTSGMISTELTEMLQAEISRSQRALKSKNFEAIISDIAARLQRSAPATETPEQLTQEAEKEVTRDKAKRKAKAKADAKTEETLQ